MWYMFDVEAQIINNKAVVSANSVDDVARLTNVHVAEIKNMLGPFRGEGRPPETKLYTLKVRKKFVAAFGEEVVKRISKKSRF